MHFLSPTSSSETPAAVVWLKRQIVKAALPAKPASIVCVYVCVPSCLSERERDVLHEPASSNKDLTVISA